jgi:hypothetical protein
MRKLRYSKAQKNFARAKNMANLSFPYLQQKCSQGKAFWFWRLLAQAGGFFA